jgi:hypothetical protein
MKLMRQLGRVIFTLGAKSGDNKVSITVKPFKNLIVVTLTMKVYKVVVRIIVFITPGRCTDKTQKKPLRLERDGYSITINNIVLFP